MNGHSEPAGSALPLDETAHTKALVSARRPFFDRTDWLGFSITAAIVFAVYLYTLAPDVTLEWSGIRAAGAMYGGNQPPAGYPLWSLYAWVFTKLLPFSNIAWRIGVSSAVAGALACGVIALIVSRGSAMLLEGMTGFRRLPAKEEAWLRVICGAVAGMAFGFHGVFWGLAVIVESDALAMLLFAIVLCLLMRWVYAPEQNRWLCAGVFVYGLTLTVHLSLAVAAPGLPFIVLFRKPSLGRDLSFAMTTTIGITLLAHKLGYLPDPLAEATQIHYFWLGYLLVGIGAAFVSVVLVVITRRLLTHWRIICAVGLLLALALSLYFTLPITSMTNPPSNWGYARTLEGFIHTIRRGQYEHPNLASNLGRFLNQVWRYADQTWHNLGFAYLLPALLPFCFLHRMRLVERGWFLGLLPTFLCLSLFMLAMLNPSPEGWAWWGMVTPYFSASHLVLAVWAGYGLVLLGTLVGRLKLSPGFHGE